MPSSRDCHVHRAGISHELSVQWLTSECGVNYRTPTSKTTNDVHCGGRPRGYKKHTVRALANGVRSSGVCCGLNEMYRFINSTYGSCKNQCGPLAKELVWLDYLNFVSLPYSRWTWPLYRHGREPRDYRCLSFLVRLSRNTCLLFHFANPFDAKFARELSPSLRRTNSCPHF